MKPISMDVSLEKIESIAKIIGVVVACFGVYKYYDSLNQERINRSLSYYDEFHSGQIFESRIELAEMSYSWIGTTKEDGTELTGIELAQFITSELSEVPGVIHFDLISEFFLRAKKCVDANGCDKETLTSLLSEDARSLYVYLFPKISERQSAGDNTSDGLICFSSKFETKGC